MRKRGFSEVGLPTIDPGNFEFKHDPFKIGVETMSNIGATARVVPGSYQPGGGWFDNGDWNPGGGYWMRPDGTLMHNPRSVGKVPRGTLTARMNVRGWPNFDPFKVGMPTPISKELASIMEGMDCHTGAWMDPDKFKMGMPLDYNRFKLGSWPRNFDRFKMGAASYSWVPGGGGYDKYTGRYNPGGGWNRTSSRAKYWPPSRGWTHSSYYDSGLIPAPGVGAANPVRQAANRLRPSNWMNKRLAQRKASGQLLQKARQGDPQARRALEKIRQLASAGNGKARRALRDIAQIAVCWNAKQDPRVSGEMNPFKMGGVTFNTGVAAMLALSKRR